MTPIILRGNGVFGQRRMAEFTRKYSRQDLLDQSTLSLSLLLGLQAAFHRVDVNFYNSEAGRAGRRTQGKMGLRDSASLRNKVVIRKLRSHIVFTFPHEV